MKIVARCGLKEIERRSPLMVTATTFVLFQTLFENSIPVWS
jgi:hypothetical protein